jgi:hypothetical protein
MRFPLVASLCVAVFASSSTLAAADDHTSSPATQGPSSPPPDIVRLKDGGMVRGTIIELVPNGSVKIELPDGQTRTFAMVDATYAGPASREAHAAGGSASSTIEPYATIHAQNAKLTLQGEQPNLTFHMETSSAQLATGGTGVRALGFSRLCTAPCSVEVPAGTQRFALSQPDGDVVRADADLVVEGQETIRGGIVDRHGIRLAGVLLLSIGVPLSAGAALLGVVLSDNPQSKAPTPLYVGGAIVGALSLTLGTILVTRRDSITLDVRPGVALLAPSLPSTPRAEGSFSPNGLTADLRF